MRDIKHVGSTLIAGLLNVPRRLDLNAVRMRGHSVKSGAELRSYRSTSTLRRLNIDSIRDSVKRISAKVLRDVATMVAPYGGGPYERSADRRMSVEIGRPTEYDAASYDVPVDIPAEGPKNSTWTEDTIPLSEVNTVARSLERSDTYEMDGTGYDSEPLCTYYPKLDSIDVKEIAREARRLLVDITQARRTMGPIPCRCPKEPGLG